jgi:ABC-type dipeptide/oligopeptide/nickel transport system permease subunit
MAPISAVTAAPLDSVASAPPQARRSTALRRFFSSGTAVFGLVLFLVLCLLAFVGRHFWRYDHTDYTNVYSEGPSLAHPFGTDSASHDVFAQVLRGTSRSIEIALIVAVLSTLVGAGVGAVAGYYRGFADSGLMRLVDLVLTLPLYAVAALLGHRYGASKHGWLAIGLVLALLLWAPIARVVRGVTLSLRQQEFIEASRALGASNRWIIVRHVLPNASGPIIVNATVYVALAILAETALSYVGFGVQSPDVSLGSLVAAGEAASSTRWWLFYFPGLVLALLVLAVNFIGDGLRDALDPSGSGRR